MDTNVNMLRFIGSTDSLSTIDASNGDVAICNGEVHMCTDAQVWIPIATTIATTAHDEGPLLEITNCTNCGATLTRLSRSRCKCEYCGTEYSA